MLRSLLLQLLYDFIYIVSDFNYLLNKHLCRLVFIISPVIFFGDDT